MFLSSFQHDGHTITVWRECTWFLSAVDDGDGQDGTRGGATFCAGSRRQAVALAADYIRELKEKKESEEGAILLLGNIERLWAAAGEKEISE